MRRIQNNEINGVVSILRWEDQNPADNRKVVGMGILIDSRHIVTCAHVLNLALQTPRDKLCQHPIPLGQQFQVGFPLSSWVIHFKISMQRKLIRNLPTFMRWLYRRQPNLRPVPAPPVICRLLEWSPPEADPRGTRDYAILQLDTNAPISCARFMSSWNGHDREFKIYGFSDLQFGLWAHSRWGSLVSHDLISVEDVPDAQVRTEPGFSGGGVFSLTDHAIIGALMAVRRGADVGFLRHSNTIDCLLPAHLSLNYADDIWKHAWKVLLFVAWLAVVAMVYRFQLGAWYLTSAILAWPLFQLFVNRRTYLSWDDGEPPGGNQIQ